MKLFKKMKDGGPASHVTGYFLIEWKKRFSIGLLHFAPGTREAFHSHAFNALTLWLRGFVWEEFPDGKSRPWKAGQWKSTLRSSMHRIVAPSTGAWALTFRGPWVDSWKEYVAHKQQIATLTHGRNVVMVQTTPGRCGWLYEKYMEGDKDVRGHEIGEIYIDEWKI